MDKNADAALDFNFKNGLGTGVHNAPNKQDSTGLDVADQEDKGTIHGYLYRLTWHRLFSNNYGGGSRSLRTCFIHGDKRFVQDVGDDQVSGTVHAREIRLSGKGCPHAHIIKRVD